ncbi:cytochrome C [Dyella sp. M7H15-1]|uniref:cytochrome c n=1 Tax=Dyella sp. M7H15-1 TaxID=2501295 RepID=UPI0010051E5F|nr:cytochrome c [Dyella sp. M7H15-1]QAU23235.1 cytochrome C [Dyella sp. M7H15-1]
MRAALLIVLGLAIGIISTVFTVRALDERNPMPQALMVTMGFHRHQLQQAVKGQHCDATANLGQLQHMQMIASDIPASFPNAPQQFQDFASHLRTALQNAAQSAPADCPALTAALKPVDQTCEECHKQYR